MMANFSRPIPAILMAAGYETRNLLVAGDAVEWLPMLTGVVVSAVSAYLCIHYFLKLLDRVGMLPFVVYRFVLGIVLFALFL